MKRKRLTGLGLFTIIDLVLITIVVSTPIAETILRYFDKEKGAPELIKFIALACLVQIAALILTGCAMWLREKLSPSH